MGYMNAVSTARQIRNVALVGFMGTGKTVVGQLVASQLHYEFLDTDEIIVTRTGRQISDIFNTEGEPAFREHESAAIAELAQCHGSVISAGGGAVLDERNLSSLKSHALVVCLWASAEAIWARVRGQTHRPLLVGPEPLGKIQQLLAERAPFYRKADVLVNTELRSVKEVAQQVIHQFRTVQPQLTQQ